MDIRKFQRLVIDALEDVKAQDIVVFNTTELSDLFDRVILVTGTSNRHTRSLAASVVDKVKEAGEHIISVEGEDTGEWVLVDAGDIVVHVMLAATREHFALEEIWGGKTVRVKLGSGTAATTARSRARATESLTQAAERKPRKTAKRKAA
jgi:ribosome-associated protein